MVPADPGVTTEVSEKYNSRNSYWADSHAFDRGLKVKEDINEYHETK